jgi:hypothetical protein
MKRLITVLISLLIFCVNYPLNAQINAGITGSVNFSTFEAELGTGEKITGRTLYGIGGVLDFKLTNRLSIQVEPVYIQKGAKLTLQTEQSDLELTFSSSFIEVPSFLKVKLGDSDVLPYILVGPTFGILINSDIDGESSGLKFSADVKKVTESFDIGLGFGAGVEYPVSTFSIFVESYYVLGLNNMQKGGTFEISSGPYSQDMTWDKKENEYSNKGLRVLFGVKFPLSH